MKKFNFVPFEEMKELALACPGCGKEYCDFPALSRRDNTTEICPECGVGEALEDRYRSQEISNQ